MPALDALPILVLIIGFGALIFVQLASRITEGLFQSKSGFAAILTAPLRLIGAVGGSVVHHLVNAMSPAIARPQQMMGAALHDDANLVRRLRAAMIGQALVVVGLAQALRGHVSAADLKAIQAGLTKRIGNAEQQARGIGADVQPRIEGAVRGIEAGVNTRVGTLDREIGRIATKELPAIRAREKSLEHGAIRTWDWIRRHPRTIATTAFVGAVAYALARLNLGWLRCNSLGKLGKRIGCGGFKLLEDLLYGIIDVLVIADLCQITTLMIRTAESSLVQTALRDLIAGVDDLLLCQGVDLPPALTGYWTAPPPAQEYAALAA